MVQRFGMATFPIMEPLSLKWHWRIIFWRLCPPSQFQWGTNDNFEKLCKCLLKTIGHTHWLAKQFVFFMRSPGCRQHNFASHGKSWLWVSRRWSQSSASEQCEAVGVGLIDSLAPRSCSTPRAIKPKWTLDLPQLSYSKGFLGHGQGSWSCKRFSDSFGKLGQSRKNAKIQHWKNYIRLCRSCASCAGHECSNICGTIYTIT